ncbi:MULTISPECIES: hypoxanthine-guanine phosphoribosyltransferase [Candidatus Ichthyocystis]|uniref:hypoxanthine-guanine phosphoribosyltransferase n=1 Tax=Candidatus Ichthyocystis TaxID=2929841 RepID=UPI000B827130|nr:MULTISPECIES: hypoxanthine-guanine phosphoribosyltransferase [Ichthyocystis]
MAESDLPLGDRFRWAEEIFVQSKLLMTKFQIQEIVSGLSAQISQDLGVLYPVVLSIMRGSLMFSGDLMRCLGFPLDFDYFDVSVYRNSTSPGDVRWNLTPRTVLDGRHVLLIDDILDHGVTLQAVCEWLSEQNVKSIRVAVLCERKINNCDPKIRADYIGFNIHGSSFVFGYGMDIYGFWRNLPALYSYDSSAVTVSKVEKSSESG